MKREIALIVFISLIVAAWIVGCALLIPTSQPTAALHCANHWHTYVRQGSYIRISDVFQGCTRGTK